MSSAAGNDEWLTEAELSREYRVPRSTLRWWRAKGTGPRHYRLSERVVRYRRSQVDEWFAARAVEPDSGRSAR
jgi:predicted DNA-binding transcriptional regulator AlpA